MSALRLLFVLAVVFSMCGCSEVSEINKIVKENNKKGASVEEWDISGSGHDSIQGFTTRHSYLAGEFVDIKVKTPSSKYRVDFYRIGYYQGHGARLVGRGRPRIPLPQDQPDCLVDEETWLYDCGTWDVSVTWKIPETAVSGIYFGRLVREDHIEEPTWRQDASKAKKDPLFQGKLEFNEPLAGEHAYGASGYGALRNKINEPYASHVYFVVRDTRPADIVVQASDTTWQAYNTYGGTSTYGSYKNEDPRPRCYKASFNRPLNNREHRPTNTVWATEFPLIRWLEKNGYEVSYQSAIDTSSGSVSDLMKHKVFISSGHDEYWSKKQRENVEAARDRGLNLMFLSGNEVFWKIRFESSPAEENNESAEDCDTKPELDQHRTLVCYKESQSTKKIDPREDMWTGTFRDSRSINPDGAYPENALTGTIFTVNAWRDDPLLVPQEYKVMRFWRNTSIASLEGGSTAILKQGLLGHEWDEDIDNGFRPVGLMHLSRTEVDNVMYIQDFGATYDSGSATHHLTMYKAASGALVFGAGTCQWSWGLDPVHQFGSFPHIHNPINQRIGVDLAGASQDVQQATANMLMDMGVSPLTLDPSLVFPAPSKDNTPPESLINTPADGAWLVLPNDRKVHMLVNAEDHGGGCVGAVEVSTNNGDSWHPARRYRPGVDTDVYGPHYTDDECNPTWVYDWIVPQTKYDTIAFGLLSRAIDDSGNLEYVPPKGQRVRQVAGGRAVKVKVMPDA